jgi:hypothetical protein
MEGELTFVHLDVRPGVHLHQQFGGTGVLVPLEDEGHDRSRLPLGETAVQDPPEPACETPFVQGRRCGAQ